MSNLDELECFVKDCELVGARRVSLGIREMPKGYALMLNCDRTHYYWLRYDGAESCIDWDKWSVYRGAKADSILKQKKIK